MSVRGEFKFPRAAAAAATVVPLCYSAESSQNPIGSKENDWFFGNPLQEPVLLGKLMAIYSLCGKMKFICPLKTKIHKTHFCN